MESSEKSALKARDWIYTHGKDYAAAKANRSYLELFLKSKLALLMKDSKETTSAAKETDAKAHPDYIALLYGIKEAIELEETIKWELESAKQTIEIYRTESANNRGLDRAVQ
jgi:hypothetical protein